MGFPGEELLIAALEKFGDSVIQKMNDAEEQRNREFAYKLKELEYYKGNYEKEIKSVFDRWFSFLENTLISCSTTVQENVKRQHQNQLQRQLSPDKALQLKIDTMKYGGTATGKALALFNRISCENNNNDEMPTFATAYVVCRLLCTLKKDILGQEIDPLTMLQVLITDYDERIDVINDGRAYVEEKARQYLCDTETDEMP